MNEFCLKGNSAGDYQFKFSYWITTSVIEIVDIHVNVITLEFMNMMTPHDLLRGGN